MRQPSHALVAETGFRHYTLLVGTAALQQSVARNEPLRAFTLPSLTPAVRDAVYRAASLTGPHPASFVTLVDQLNRLGVATPTMAQCLPLSRSDISRLRAAASVPQLAEGLQTGRLTLHHARLLLSLPEPQLQENLELSLANRWKPSQLAKRIRGTAPVEAATIGDPDLTAEEKWLGGMLGTGVRVASQGGRGQLVISWSRAADLLGVLERLGGAPNPPDGLPVRARELVIPFVSLQEYEALVGHMRDDR